ncbi:tRNA1(Val) A37 N6-methylase TrmN6 [Meinhardsimonia xiamenensis]|uniref:tRNA1(Val) A37 N6-methylase TrmN6 n=1 Tax=Meinhardsimonia xiamenensis TaxID=990712 RepID=A0A1G8YHG5_9RHOB|nr:methyltransferase domain-containing protein [Meinhardsimonia xiamenensis]PRX37302.1 tRNA1(Val) A37 N6-methylase TrmN6 [Meinhardsimonia xiamenensis]SDK02117.1 tRNA1(Val) A37 N6-methylase TrmN6 [Meinhardsimonia xiamenensis]
MSAPLPPDLTEDGFLGGRLVIAQPARGFRSGTDAVLLAAAVPAEAGQTVLELGCGAGAAALCLARRVPGVRVTGVEILPAMAALARRNAERNGLALEVIEADVGALPRALRARSFDHVMMNPPYFTPGSGTSPEEPGRAMGNAGPRALGDWLDTGIRRLGPKGRLTVIQRSERLPEILRVLEGRLGQITVLPLQGRTGRPADRVIVTGRKGSRAPFRLLAPLVIHEGHAHVEKGESFTPAVARVLREGAGLPVAWG